MHVGALCSVLTGLALTTAAPSVLAGPLNPPAGAVAATGKTLAEVEPRTAVNAANTPGDADSLFKITQPGSYYLAGNVTGVAARHGIEIAASGVTLDLGGFDVAGVPGSLSGITVTAGGISTVTVRNGSVRNWAGAGIDTNTAGVIGGRIEQVTAAGNGTAGFLLGYSFAVHGCVAVGNTTFGFRLFNGAVVAGCAARQNNDGFSCTSAGVFTDCASFDNTGFGFFSGLGSTFRSCNATSNGDDGITTTSGTSIVDCTAVSNNGDGISFSAHCVVRGNACYNNGAAGVHATGDDNRIEGNNCTSSPRGMDVDAAGNFISRNTCSGNTTNWAVVQGNRCLVVVAANAPAINGDAGGAAPGSADPNANFTY